MRTARSIGVGSGRPSRREWTDMQLKSPDSPDDLRLLAGWLAQKENYQWLDFGDGRQLVSPEWLKMAMQRGTSAIRLFTPDDDDRPIGAAALSNINTRFR